MGRHECLVNQLVDLEVLAIRGTDTCNRRFHAPDVLDVLLRGRS